MLKFLLIALLAIACDVPAVHSESWPKPRGCMLKIAGGVIKPGKKFTTLRGYAFIRAANVVAWEAGQDPTMPAVSQTPNPHANGAIKVFADVVMIAKNRLEVCFGGQFEGVVEHPELGEIYINSTQSS